MRSTITAAGSGSHRGERPSIVFLHGTRLTGASWSRQVVTLSDEFHCLTPDLPGHGRAESETFEIETAADRIAELIATQAQGGRAIVVGLSLGGYVAMALAARWPDRVVGLVISGATAEPLGVLGLAYRGLAGVFSVVPEPLLERISRWFFAWRFPPAVAAPILADGFSSEGGAIAVRSLVGERFKPRLALYPGPTLLINGEFDLFFRPGERSFAAVAAEPRRALIRRATHLANLDQPDEFSDSIRRFARSIRG